MQTENLETLKIHKLSQAQYDRELAAGNLDENAIYLTPDEEVDFSNYVRVEDLYTTAITTSGTSAAYTVTIDGISALTAGTSFIMVPHVESASTSPTLNVNNLGAIRIRRRLSSSTTTTSDGASDEWLTAGKPIRVTYDGTFWIADLQRPSATDLMGAVPIVNGGTGVNSEDDFRTLITSTAYQIGGDAPSSGPILWFDTTAS